MEKIYGPTLAFSDEIHSTKYRSKGESFKEAMSRVADALKDNEEHFKDFRDTLLDMRFLPAGRIQASVGSPRQTTPYNCFVSRTIRDSMEDIMDAAKEAAETMRLGGGIGYDFSTLRPRGDIITSLDSRASGPVSFMQIFDAICKTISSAGHRRGAQMGVLRIDHPDIEEFIEAKHNHNNLTQFNVSVAVTDEFMDCLINNKPFTLKWSGRNYRTINSQNLWDKIMRSTWDWAEPGILFIDRINRMNNLNYCEIIAATNPCGEQPLPPYGACLLGSFNLTKYIGNTGDGYFFNYLLFKKDIPIVVRAIDNVIDRSIYPLGNQYLEATNKRRMGLGITGLANAVEALGFPYGSPTFLTVTDSILSTLANEAYEASALLAKEKGAFPHYREAYLSSEYLRVIKPSVKELIHLYGIRNSHLISIAPTGTISLCADNISSGIEPVFSHSYYRTVTVFEGTKEERVTDYGLSVFNVMGKVADLCTPDDHIGVLNLAAKWADSSVSKTCNIGPDISFEDFKEVYMNAWKGGAKGCTTFRSAGKRYGILNTVAPSQEDGTQACYFNPETGSRTCE